MTGTCTTPLGLCGGVVVVHRDRSMTCSDAACVVPPGPAFLAHHVTFVGCPSIGAADRPAATADHGGCPRCTRTERS